MGRREADRPPLKLNPIAHIAFGIAKTALEVRSSKVHLRSGAQLLQAVGDVPADYQKLKLVAADCLRQIQFNNDAEQCFEMVKRPKTSAIA